jgi:hypothetical protein
MDAARQLQEATPGRGGPDRPGHGMHAERVSYIISSMPPVLYVRVPTVRMAATLCIGLRRRREEEAGPRTSEF